MTIITENTLTMSRKVFYAVGYKRQIVNHIQ